MAGTAEQRPSVGARVGVRTLSRREQFPAGARFLFVFPRKVTTKQVQRIDFLRVSLRARLKIWIDQFSGTGFARLINPRGGPSRDLGPLRFPEIRREARWEPSASDGWGGIQGWSASRVTTSWRAARNYNEWVARGWESKSVEAQQAEAGEKSAKPRKLMSPGEAARWREMESLRLSRQAVLQQLESSQNPRHRKLLENSLAALDEKLKNR